MAGPGIAQQQETPAAPPEALQLSLGRAVELALEQNPTLAAAREELPAAVARQQMMRSDGRLRASGNLLLSTATMPNILPGPAAVMPQMLMGVPDEPRADASLMFMYPLSTGRRVGSQVAAEGARVEATQADIDRMALEVAYGVRAAYWKVLLSDEIVKVQEENLAQQQERLRVDQVAYDAGKIPLYYVLRDQAEVAAAQQGLTNARRDAETSLLDLLVAMGLIPSTPLALTDELTSARPPTQPDVAGLVAEALENRPEARAIRSRAEAARRDVDARRAAYRPQLDAMLMVESEKVRRMERRGGYTLGVVASLPVLDGGSRAAAVNEADAMRRQLEQQQTAVRLEIERQLRAALIELDAATKNIGTARDAVAAAEEDHRVALMRYQAGKAINLEPISALAALVQARTNYVQALFEFSLARDAVDQAVGMLPAPPAATP